jgi:hypothetical protein
VVVPLLWLLSFPIPATGGYDTAHIVERTCEAGGPLIVADEWKRARDRDRLLTEPGEVIGCAPVGRKGSFQIAAGPERIGGDYYVCTLFSLRNGDGADVCSGSGVGGGADPVVDPLMAVRGDRQGGLAVSGIVSDDVASLSVAHARAAGVTMFPVDQQRAARLGAERAFGFFSLSVSGRAACGAEPVQLIGRDRSGERITVTELRRSTWLLDALDRATYATRLKDLCGPRTAAGSEWLSEIGAVLRSIGESLLATAVPVGAVGPE